MPANKKSPLSSILTRFASFRIVKILTTLGVFASGAGLIGFLPFSAALATDPASQRIIIECGSGVVDEFSLAECVTLKLEQAEATLMRAEETWQSLLQSAARSETDDALDKSNQPQSDALSHASTTENDDAQVPASEVIAIVNDTALRQGISTGGSKVINVDEGRTGAAVSHTDKTFDAAVDIQQRFGFLPALFRSFRDQQCAWQASMFGSDRPHLYYQACLAAMAQTRAQELTRYLALKRSSVSSGTSFRGYYVKTENGAVFQACDRRTDWWVSGADSILSALDRRYRDIQSANPGNTNVLYSELRGKLLDAPDDGPGADFSAALAIGDINLLRPVTESDCNYQDFTKQTLLSAQSSQGTDVESVLSAAATVDDYASSGFLYGYFNFWVAACSVAENSVCSAETEAEFASDGGWKLRVDRSIEGDWRVMLVPTTDDQLIEKQLTLQINGSDIFLDKSFLQPLRLPMRQGVDIAEGELARDLVAKLKLGRELRFQWFDEANVMSELKFSLLGVTRALQYFDSAKS